MKRIAFDFGMVSISHDAGSFVRVQTDQRISDPKIAVMSFEGADRMALEAWNRNDADLRSEENRELSESDLLQYR